MTSKPALDFPSLAAAGRRVPVPFCLEAFSGDSPQTLEFTHVLRIVPGRRLTGIARWDGRVVVAKLFYQRGHWRRNLQRDVRGVEALQQAGVLTPSIIRVIEADAGGGGILLLEYLAQGENLGALFEAETDPRQQQAIMEKTLDTIALCHENGLWQKDIHLDNFMLSGDRIYLLDGGDVHAGQTPLEAATRRDNLALFFAQFPAAFDRHLEGSMDYYLTRVSESSRVPLAGMLADVQQSRRQRLAHLEDKLFRATTRHHCVSSWRQFAMVDRAALSTSAPTPLSTAIEDFLQHPDACLEGGELLKAGNTSTVAAIRLGERDCVVKRYNIKNFWHGLTRLVQPSRAHHSWRNAAVLEMLGILTPHPIVMLEERILRWGRRRAFFLCERLEGPTLDVLIGDPTRDAELRLALEQMHSLLQTLATYGISHGDMKATNFVMHDRRLAVLDLDGMRRFDPGAAFAHAFRKDLARFEKNFTGSTHEAVVRSMMAGLNQELSE